MKKIIALTAALMLASPAHGQDPQPPSDMETHTVPIVIHCVNDMARMIQILAEQFGETWVVASEMSNVSVMWLFANLDNTTSTLVLQRVHKDYEEVCIIWSGQSEDHFAFVKNENPQFPTKKGKEM